MQKSIDFVLRAFHLESDGVIDPIADGGVGESAIGNRWREGERSRIEFGKVEVEIHRQNVAVLHRLEVVAFARGTGSREIDAQLVAHQESDDGTRHRIFGLDTDADQNA